MRLSVAEGDKNQRLGSDDVRVLLHHNDAATRAAVVRKISYVFHYASLSRKEQETAIQIFHMILHDKSPMVRQSMAEVLKSCPHAPVEIIQSLAEDQADEVAVPVLQHSELLSEADLVAMVEATDAIFRLLAIAARYSVGEKLSGALVEKKQPKVVVRLVENPGAKIPAPLFLQIANDYAADGHLLPAMKQRQPLPLAAIARVAEVQRQQRANDNPAPGGPAVLTGYKVAAGEIRHYYHAFASLPSRPTGYTYERLVEEMNSLLRLNSFSMLVGMMMGHEGFVVQALATKLRLPLIKAEEICQHPYSPLFGVMCEQARIVPQQVAVLQWLLTEVRDLQKIGCAQGQVTALKLLPRMRSALADGLLRDEMKLVELLEYLADL